MIGFGPNARARLAAVFAFAPALTLACSLVPPSRTYAQEAAANASTPRGPAEAARATASTPDAEVTVDPASPQASMARFFAAARSGRYDEAAVYLDLPAAVDRAASARRLSLVLDRTVWVDVERLSASASGDVDDALPQGVDEIARIPAQARGGEAEPVRISRHATAHGSRWLFTRATTARIDVWYQQLEGRYLLDRVPTRLLREGPYHIAQWQWIALGVLLLLALLVGTLLASLARRIGLALVRRTKASWDDEIPTVLVGPLRLALAILAFDTALPELGLALPVFETIHHGRNLLLVLVALAAAMRAVRVVASHVSASEWGRTNPSSRSLVTLSARIGDAVAIVVAVLAVLSSFGYDVTGVIAGLGVGGVVLALAAQKTVENLLGAFAIGIDQPLREGDLVKIDGVMGTVERVGLRSTRIRTPDRHVVAYPNGKLADTPVESVSSRDRMRMVTTLGVEYGTSSATLRAIRDALEAAARAHPLVFREELHVRFVAFGPSSLDFEIVLWLLVRDGLSFGAAREELLLAFMEVVEKHGVAFAFPTRTIHLVDPRKTGG